MNQEAVGYWDRALKTFQTAKILLTIDWDSSASRSYYAAFYAVSALFSLEGKSFHKHTAIETAVHRDLVKTGRWSIELGYDYSFLLGARLKGDYEALEHITEEKAINANNATKRILSAVQTSNPDFFADPDDILQKE